MAGEEVPMDLEEPGPVRTNFWTETTGTLAHQRLQKFLAKCGPTKGCNSCMTRQPGTKHNMCCRDRQAQWEAEVAPREASTTRAMKRARDPQAEEEAMMQEELDRINSLELGAMIPSSGPPWYDSVTGEELDDSKVADGMRAERECMKKFNVFEPVTAKQAAESGARVTGSR